MLVEVGNTNDIPVGEARRFVVNGVEIAVANMGGGRFLALGDVCSHAESSLSEGEVYEEQNYNQEPVSPYPARRPKRPGRGGRG